MRQGRFPDWINIEADIEAAAMVQDVPAVEDEGGFLHTVEDLPEIEITVQVPLSQERDGVAAFRGACGVFDVTDLTSDSRQIIAGVFQGLRIGDHDFGLFLEKPPGDEDRGALPGIARVCLEGKTPQADPLPGQGVEHGPSMFRIKRSCW